MFFSLMLGLMIKCVFIRFFVLLVDLVGGVELVVVLGFVVVFSVFFVVRLVLDDVLWVLRMLLIFLWVIMLL